MIRLSKGYAVANATPALIGSVVAFVLSLALASCSSELHEIAGPVVPVPNVEGRIVRGSLSVPNWKVKLEPTGLGDSVGETRTDSDGRFGLVDVGAGDWTLRVDSVEPGDFGRVTYRFVFDSSDTSITCPSLDLSLRDFELKEPESGDVVDVPNLFAPLGFRWKRPEGTTDRMRIRLYQTAEAGGEPVWFSQRTLDEEIRWNGLGNQSVFAGRFVPVGIYQWRLDWEVGGEEELEFQTQNRMIEFRE